jgi:hypothetical protein
MSGYLHMMPSGYFASLLAQGTPPQRADPSPIHEVPGISVFGSSSSQRISRACKPLAQFLVLSGRGAFWRRKER